MDKVWVLVIETKYGTNVEVHRTEGGAQDSLVAFVDRFWSSDSRIEDDSERVEFYFENSFDEFYSIQVVEVED